MYNYKIDENDPYDERLAAFNNTKEEKGYGFCFDFVIMCSLLNTICLSTCPVMESSLKRCMVQMSCKDGSCPCLHPSFVVRAL